MTAKSKDQNPLERITLDELTTQMLSQRTTKAIEQTHVRRSFGLHFVVDDGVVSYAVEGSVGVGRMLITMSLLGTLLWVILTIAFPDIVPLTELLRQILTELIRLNNG